jgi:hypothetical protein
MIKSALHSRDKMKRDDDAESSRPVSEISAATIASFAGDADR